jgi:hypothetical protein
MARYALYPFLYAITLCVIGSCSNDNETARLKIILTDSPGDYSAVNIDIKSVQVSSNANADNSDPGWTTLTNSSIGVINLLDYTNGTELTLFNSEFPTGNISQIRLTLGPDNSISVDGNTYPLETPAAQQSGLNLQVHASMNSGITYKFILDFDASRSIVKSGNSTYLLKPVINVISTESSGAISGVVNPAGENVAILVKNNLGETVASSYAVSGTANYLVPGVAPGAYDLVFDLGESSNYKTKTLENIVVSLGMINREDTVNLEEK